MGSVTRLLRDEYDKLNRKNRTVENMVSMAVSRELSKENATAYTYTNNDTAIHAIKPFSKKKPNFTSNKKPKNKCSKCGRLHDFGKCPAKDKTYLICQKPGHFAKCCIIKIGDNPVTSQLVLQEQIKLQYSHLNKS